jgi:methyltransferase (TIGR00027 family)
MKENQASFTAIGAAYLRAYHAIHSTDKIFDDFLAYDLIPEENRALIEQHLIEHYLSEESNNSKHATLLSDQITTSMHFTKAINIVISRARYTEDTLEEAVRQGVKQYVILGAGMDIFAFRRPEMLEKLEVFEVGSPSHTKI